MTPAEVGTQVDRILASSFFAASPRLTAFLRHIVEKFQAGELDSLKEYTIGVEVFERGARFDPRIDNIVRIQAAKLRSKLIEYYSADGQSDPIIIHMPKGGYVPELRIREKPVRVISQPLSRSRIAVLPFVNMSSDQENEYLSDGLTEEVINRLASVPGLSVVARTSVFRFKGQSKDIRELGRDLNVGVVLEGSIRKAGTRLRVTAQLIEVENGFQLFSQTYDRELSDVFQLQDELAETVAKEIAPATAPLGSNSQKTPSLEAYYEYLRGLFAMSNKFLDLDACIECFRGSLTFDPEYHAAWAGMSHGYFLLAWFYRAHFEIAMPLSREAALKSVMLNPDSALGLHSLATAECVLEWQWASAEARFTRGIALQPSLAIGYIEYAVFCLVPQLRFKEALAIIEKGLALDPFNPLLHAVAIHMHGRLGDHEQAMRQYSIALRVAPEYPPISITAGMSHEWNGDRDEAIELYRRSCSLSDDAPFPLSSLAHAVAMRGDHREANRLLKKLKTGPIVAASDLARVYCGLQDKSQTVHYLEVAARSKCMYLLRVTGDPRFDWLLTQPRFRAILHTMGLPLPSSRTSL